MDIPNRVLIRMYLHFGGKYRKFYWFEMKEDELYWGQSLKKSPLHSQSVESANTITVTVPEDFKEYEEVNTKYSYHRSGKVHIKEQKQGSQPVYSDITSWKRKQDIDRPHRIESLITAQLSHYSETVERPKSNLKKDEYSICIDFGEEDVSTERLYLEFYVSPEGTFEFPNALLSTEKLPIVLTHSLSPHLILVVGLTTMKGLENWQPNVSISLIGDTKSE